MKKFRPYDRVSFITTMNRFREGVVVNVEKEFIWVSVHYARIRKTYKMKKSKCNIEASAIESKGTA